MSDQDFQKSVAGAPRALIDAQRDYTRWTDLLATARDEFARAEISYEIRLANYIRDNTGESSKDRTITVLKEIGKAECSAEFTAKVLAECSVKKAQDALNLATERINTSKALMRVDFGSLK